MTPERLDWVVEQLDLRPGLRVLEIGGGHGVAATAVLDRIGTDGRYLSIDRSERLTSAAAARNAAAVSDGRARFEVADLMAAAVGPASQDRVFGCRVAALARPAPLAAVLGWLAPGGTLALAFDDPDPVRTDRLVGDAAASAQLAGARLIDTRRLPLGSGAVVLSVFGAT